LDSTGTHLYFSETNHVTKSHGTYFDSFTTTQTSTELRSLIPTYLPVYTD